MASERASRSALKSLNRRLSSWSNICIFVIGYLYISVSSWSNICIFLIEYFYISVSSWSNICILVIEYLHISISDIHEDRSVSLTSDMPRHADELARLEDERWSPSLPPIFLPIEPKEPHQVFVCRVVLLIVHFTHPPKCAFVQEDVEKESQPSFCL